MDRDKAGASMKIGGTSPARDRKRLAGESQNGCSTQRYDEFWMHEPEFLIQPPSIVLDLAHRRFLVDASLAALLELEMLDGVGDIDTIPVDARFRQSPIKELAGWSDKWPALPVLLIARLLTHEGNRSTDGALAQDSTCCARD